MKSVKVILILALSTFFTNCDINDDKRQGLSKEIERIDLFLVDKNESIQVRDLEEVKQLLVSKYGADNQVVKESVSRIQMLQEELEYTNNLDLDNEDVARKYQERLDAKFGKPTSEHKKSANGILWDNNQSGFLSVTTIPLNLSSSKVNKASSWSAITPGIVTLCDKKWFRGNKFVVFSIFPGPTPVIPSSFDNKTDSFF